MSRRQRRRVSGQALLRGPAPFFDTDVSTDAGSEAFSSSFAAADVSNVPPFPHERGRSSTSRGMGLRKPHEDHYAERPRRGVVVSVGPVVRGRTWGVGTIRPSPLLNLQPRKSRGLGYARVTLNRRDYVCVARAIRRSVLFALVPKVVRRGGGGSGRARRLTAASQFHCGR